MLIVKEAEEIDRVAVHPRDADIFIDKSFRHLHRYIIWMVIFIRMLS